MKGGKRFRELAAPWIAALGFVAVVATFVVFARDFAVSSTRLVKADLAEQADAAARNLAEPLRTLDFHRIGEVGAAIRNHALRLSVRSGRNVWMDLQGVVYDSKPGDPMTDAPTIWEWRTVGDYSVGVGIESFRVLRPLLKALPLFLLSVLVGAVGMLFVFFAMYRQRAKIRELARIETERREFIADFSHELKTPLTGILGAVEMMDDSPLTKLVRDSSRRLNALAQQVLDLSRLERGNVGSTLSTAELIQSAVDNLVGNAKRHSGSSEISVREETRGKFRCWVVEDHGIGVPEEYREKIFERFFRVDPSRSAESGGAGLGLAIVRRIARNLGGDCICEPVAPHGARFVFSVPKAVLEAR